MPRIRVLKGMTEIAELDIKPDQLYTFGRSKASSIILPEKSISRNHFTIQYKDNTWKIKKLSKFGQLVYNNEDQTTLDLIGDDVFNVPPFTFELWNKEKEVKEDSLTHSTASKVKEIPHEKTATGESEIIPYLKVSFDGQEDIYKLEGNSWIIGRSQTCQVIISDKKVSREQIELYKVGSTYYLKLIKQSNKVFLNNNIIGSEVEELHSGDTIRVGDSVLTFEIRDADFQKEIQGLTQNITQNPKNYNIENLRSMIEAQKSNTPNGVIRFDSKQKSKNRTSSRIHNSARKKILATVACITVLFALFSNDITNKFETLEQASKEYESELDLLTPEQKKTIENTYNEAKNLMIRKKYELAKAEIEKIHKIIPEYRDSKKVEEQIEQFILNKQQKAEIDRMAEEQKIAEERAREILETCKEKYNKSYDLISAEKCLAPSLELNPENPDAQSLISKIKERISKREKKKSQNVKYKKKVAKGKKLFDKANALRDEKKPLDAIEAYEAHINSKHPDPNKLKKKSKEAISELKKEIEEQIQTSISIAEKEYANSKLKEAIVNLRRALDLDPQHKEARQLLEKVSSELNQKMKMLYSDSVLEEHMGQIESALTKWKKIKDLDIPTGDYYNKATSKLRKYKGI